MLLDEHAKVEGPEGRYVQFRVPLPAGVNPAVAESFQASFEKAARLMFSTPDASRDVIERADEIVRLVPRLFELSDELLF